MKEHFWGQMEMLTKKLFDQITRLLMRYNAWRRKHP